MSTGILEEGAVVVRVGLRVADRVLADFQKDKAARLETANERYLRRRADVQLADDVR